MASLLFTWLWLGRGNNLRSNLHGCVKPKGLVKIQDVVINGLRDANHDAFHFGLFADGMNFHCCPVGTITPDHKNHLQQARTVLMANDEGISGGSF